ncbi:CDP-diacylglycerol--glycerol-3-phosphate 3-phosphatidyltransferase 2-like isoform X2 [Telopea speciosissima]|uniref:CDP-diacylglycerol--glycerol-3-phosphate 3-phosphatidyltransferase 2-like isoform X2 n=1 Tax=Telopea speciosissima TaxID=54955 RepID=UPI001CC5FB0B|nr:CDP-diacylglycerol--glycerol-3-phosphate 3-phosphatidyltransferase 2-like isoform X2 [Telopea speciosissima]
MEEVGLMARTKGSVALSSSNGDKGERLSVGWRDGWRLLSCAYFGIAFPNVRLRRDVGSRSPAQKALSSASSGSNEGPVADMGIENKDYRTDKDWSPSLPLNQQQQLQSPRLLTLPTILTLGRVAAVPLLVCTFYANDWWGKTATTVIFIAAAITDWLDGYIARKMRLSTAFGAFLDPVADKLMVGATLVLLCTRPLEVAMFGEVPWLLTVPSIAIIGREITMSAVREWAASQNSKVLEAVAVNNLGKWKTATQMTALTVLLATRDSSLTGSGILAVSGIILLYISAGLAVWSLAVYMRKIWRVLLK